MQLTPRYGGTPVLRFDPPVPSPDVPLLRQRRRLAATLAGLDAGQWGTPSRCAGWTCRDVVRHLVGVDRFWAASVTAGRAGEPTRFLVGFDPVATPAAMVAGAPETTDAELLADLESATGAFAAALAGLDGDGWALPGEAPPGHLALSEVAAHALWDAWVHERDICLPLGIDVPAVPDEVGLALRYAAALGPALQATSGNVRTGVLRVRADRPALDLVVEARPDVVVRPATAADDGCPEVRGDAVDLAESFSLRAGPPDLPEASRWMWAALASSFDLDDQSGPAAGTATDAP